jgi:hypothetical protein
MPSQTTGNNNQYPPEVSQELLNKFVEQHRLERATLGGLTFFMNPDVTITNQWLVNMGPTGSGYVRQVWGAQPYTLRLDGTTGVMGYDNAEKGVADIKQMLKKFAPLWNNSGYNQQNKTYPFYFPIMGIHEDVYIDSFTRSIASQHSLYIFYSMSLTVMPPKIARDYQPLSPVVSPFDNGNSGQKKSISLPTRS